MKLNRPKEVTFWIAVLLVVLGVWAHIGTLSGLAAYDFWLVVIGFVILALGNMLKNL